MESVLGVLGRAGRTPDVATDKHAWLTEPLLEALGPHRRAAGVLYGERMDPDRYCLDEAAPPGSSLHYATLFTSARERAALVAVHALRRTLLDIIENVADPHVRAHKLNWWSNEIMEARDGRARHPVAVAITRHGEAKFWHHPEVLAMLSAIGRASAAGGFESRAARDRFCEDVGGGTARLCGAVTAAGAGPADDVRALGTALEAAMLAGAPGVRSGLKRIPCAVPGSPVRMNHDGPDTAEGRQTGGRRSIGDFGGAAHGTRGGRLDDIPAAVARRPEVEPAGDDPGRAARRADENHVGDDSGGAARRITEERVRAHRALTDAVRDVPEPAGPAALVYGTLAHMQLAALEGALRTPIPAGAPPASITPIRKLWIAWRAVRRAG